MCHYSHGKIDHRNHRRLLSWLDQTPDHHKRNLDQLSMAGEFG